MADTIPDWAQETETVPDWAAAPTPKVSPITSEALLRPMPVRPSTTAGGPPQAGGNWDATSEELNISPLGIDPNKVPSGKGLMAPVRAAERGAAGLGQFLTSPMGIAQSAAAITPGVGLVQRAKFLYDMVGGAVEGGKSLMAQVNKIADDPAHATDEDIQAVNDTIVNVALSAFMAGKLGEHEFTQLTGKPVPTAAKPPISPVQGPLATGRVMATPQGAKPPVMPAVDAGTDPDDLAPSKEQVTGPVVKQNLTTATPPLSEKIPSISDKNQPSEPPVTPAEKPQIPPSPPATAPAGGAEPDLVAARSILDQYGTIGLSQLQRKAKLPYARAQAAIDTLQKTGEIERVGPNSPWTKVKPPESVKPPQPAIEKATPSLESPVGAKLPDIAVEKQPGQPKATGEPSKNQGKAPRAKSIDTPASATAKVAEHVSDVVHNEGMRPAKEVKAAYIQRVEDEINKGIEESQTTIEPLADHPGEWTARSLGSVSFGTIEKVGNKFKATAKRPGGNSDTKRASFDTEEEAKWFIKALASSGEGRVTMDIPGDGTTKSFRDGDTLTSLWQKVKALDASSKTVGKVHVPSGQREVTPEKAIEAFGGASKAYMATKRQIASLETPEEKAQAEAFAEELYKHTDAARLEAQAQRARETAQERRDAMNDSQSRIDKLNRLKKQTPHHKSDLAEEQKHLASAKERMEFFDRSAEDLEQQSAKAKLALGIEPKTQTDPSPIPQGPGAKTASEGTRGELPESLESGTSLKNATADLERVAMGLPEATPTDRQEMGAAWQKAVNSNPLEAKRIADAIMANPRRSLTGDESALLLKYKVDLGNALNNAAERTWTEKTPEGKAQAQVEVARFSDEFNKLLDAIKERGSEWGREGRWRQAVAQEDYSFAAQERLARAAKGSDLTNSERQQLLEDAAKYKRISDALQQHITEKDKRISELEAAKVLADIERSTKPTIPDIIIKTAEKFVAKLDTAADAARKRSMERWRRTSAFIDPTMLSDAAIIGASHIAHIGLDFAKWSARMVEDLGDAVKPHLQTIYEASQKQVDDLAETAPPPIKAKVKRVVAKMDVPTKQTTIKAKIAEKFKTGKRGDITNDVAQLAKTFVEQGIRGRDALIDAVHQALQEFDPEITRREAMDAISGYGDFRQVSKDVISVVLRDLKGQMQQVGKLEDMAAGKAPLKTGFERRTPSDEERRLQKQVAEKKKEGGYTSRDPESELRSALQTAKTVVENQIKDLTKEIETRERIVKERRQLVPDQELTDLKAKRDELKKQHDEVFFNSELSHAEKVKRATALLDSQIKKVEEQLKTGEIFPPGKPSGEMGPLDPEIEIRRQRLQELKDRRAALRESSQPSVVPEVRDANALAAGLRAEEKALKKRIDDLERQISSKTRDVKTPSTRPTNPAIEALKAKRDALKEQFDAIFGRAGMSDAERLAAWKKRAQDSIEEYQRRLDEKDYATKPKRPITMDAEAQKLLAEKEAISKKFKARLRDWKRANLPKTERAFDWVSNVRRFSVLSGVNVLGKLAAYTPTRIATMIGGELTGNINRLPGLRNVAEKAPSEGENSLPILSRAVAKGFTKGIQDAWSVLRTGKSDLKTAYSNRLEEGWQWHNIPQQIHEVIKSPLRRVAFENSLAKRMNFAAKNGADITDPFTQLALAKDAYLDSDRALLLEQNKVANGIRQMFKRWEDPSKATGKPTLTGKALATVGRIEFPILTVPFNYMKQTLENAFGLITGTVKYRAAVKAGLENLKPEEADAIARHFKYGSIGFGMLLWGFFDGYNNGGNGTFGGFYQPGEKRRPDQAGVAGARIMGHNIPGLLLHNPMISVAQLGHTIGAIAASKIKKTGEKRGLTAGLVAGSIGLLNQSPVGSATEFVSQLSGPSSEDYALGTHVKSLLIPQLIQEAANYQDRDANGNPIKRDPHGVTQYLESGLPFLREKLPVKVEKLPPGVQREVDKLLGVKR